jgi:excisionase family DNA binding protein
MVFIPMNSKFATVKEVVEQYGISQVSVIRMIKEGRFQANKFGWRWLINRDSLNAYFESRSNLLSDQFDGSQPITIQSPEKQIA